MWKKNKKKNECKNERNGGSVCGSCEDEKEKDVGKVICEVG